MVLQKRLDYGFNGYQVPPIPRAPRSARRRASFRKKFHGNQMGAFDLLATIAGNLLLEREHSPSSVDKLNEKDSELDLQSPIVDHSVKDTLHIQNDGCSGLAYVITTLDCSENASKLVNGERRIKIGNIASNVDVASNFCCKLEDENKKQIKSEPPITGNVSINANADIRDDVKLVFRDDDENSSLCTQPSIVNKAFKPPPCIGDRRIRKILTSKYWKLTAKLKDEKHFSTDGELKPVYRNRKNCYKHQRSLSDYHLKKRRLYDRISLLNSKRDVSATGMSAFAAAKHRSFQPCHSHVRLKIKSFRVPELFIEIAETATVGSLKRTVMDAVTAILSGGLRVGVLLHGKKIRDDNKTLLQTGISHNNELDALGFTLEPNPSLQAPPHQYPDDPSFLQSSEIPPSLIRYTTAPPSIVEQGTFDTSQDHVFIESDYDSALSPADMVMDKRALVVVPAMAAVPMLKSKGRDVGQRRIRRPFSVSEVETLVQAVEKLGTGRWRDVKLRAFDNVKQRTYVDLKDKWKTLVHTARISPQQRRGEPVPQELLDRVLIAHAYWSKQQHLKQYL